MSSQALLEAIETAGQDELAHLERETRDQVAEILAQSQDEAKARREAANKEALRPVAAERARRLHEAQMEALKTTASAQGQATGQLQASIEEQLQALRAQPEYGSILRYLVEEAVQELGEVEMAPSAGEGAKLPSLEVDVRDEELAREVIEALAIEMTISPVLTSWGGVVARSSDGCIVVTNTLESRLKQIESHLGTFIRH